MSTIRQHRQPRCRIRDGQYRWLCKSKELDREIEAEQDDAERHERGHDHGRRKRQGARRFHDRPRRDHDRLGRSQIAALAAPLLEHVLGIQSEVDRVIAQEPLRIDGPRKLPVVASFQGTKVAGSDLGVAFCSKQVDALALTGTRQSIRQGRRRVGRCARPVRRHRTTWPNWDAATGTGSVAGAACLVARAHAQSSPLVSSASEPGSSRRRTTRAFEPSNAPM